MRAVRVWNVVPLAVAMSLLAFACASPPEAEKKAADAAVSAAQSAGAEKYAPSEFSAMTAAVKRPSPRGATGLQGSQGQLQVAKDLADKATQAAGAGKAVADAAKADAEKQLAELDARWQSFREGCSRPKNIKATRRRSGGNARASPTRSRPPKPRSHDAGAAKAKLAAIPAELDNGGRITALATPKKDDKKPAAKK